jgi:hypothetical protein
LVEFGHSAYGPLLTNYAPLELIFELNGAWTFEVEVAPPALSFLRRRLYCLHDKGFDLVRHGIPPHSVVHISLFIGQAERAIFTSLDLYSIFINSLFFAIIKLSLMFN